MAKPDPVFLTVDIVLIHARRQILLIKRKNEPFQGKWALPGGFVDPGERLEEAAMRELTEETDVHLDSGLRQVGAFGDPDRDPRGRTVSVAYLVLVEQQPHVTAGSDAGEAAWFELTKLPDLAFDHRKIIDQAMKMMD